METSKQYVRQFIYGGLFVAFIVGAIALSNFLATSEAAVELMAQAGYAGLVVLGIIGGLNLFVPIPAAVFSELYTAAGLSTIGIITALALGTLIADLLGFWIGRLLRTTASDNYPKIVAFVTNLRENYAYLVLPFVGLYAAIVPFPNEAILIPLAISGIKIRYLLLPLIIGNLIHQTLLIFGLKGLLAIFGL